jgi:hypothetical protein
MNESRNELMVFVCGSIFTAGKIISVPVFIGEQYDVPAGSTVSVIPTSSVGSTISVGSNGKDVVIGVGFAPDVPKIYGHATAAPITKEIIKQHITKTPTIKNITVFLLIFFGVNKY